VVCTNRDFHELILLKAASGSGSKKNEPAIEPAPVIELSFSCPSLFVVLVFHVFLAGLHAFLHVVNRRVNGLDRGDTMPAFIVLGFFQVVLGLLQSFKCSLHMRLVVIIVACNGSDWHAQKTQNNG